MLKSSEPEARARFPNLVVASLGANRKDKPNGTVTARVLFDGTHGFPLTRGRESEIRNEPRLPQTSNVP